MYRIRLINKPMIVWLGVFLMSLSLIINVSQTYATDSETSAKPSPTFDTTVPYIAPKTKGEATDLITPTSTVANVNTNVTQKVARAATTYKIQDLIDQGIIKTTVTWGVYSQSEDDVAQGYTGTYYPEKLIFRYYLILFCNQATRLVSVCLGTQGN